LDTSKPVNLDKIELFAFGLDHSEGITVTPSGSVYAGGEGGQIYLIEGESFTEVANVGGFLLGLASDADGRIYAIDNSPQKCVWRYDPTSGSVEAWLSGTDEVRLAVPNWGAFGPDGSYYLSDSGEWERHNGRILVRRPGGRLEVLTDRAVDFPNGCAVSADGTVLYFVTSCPGGIWELTLDGSTEPRLLQDLGLVVPDGIAVAADGALIVACYRPDAIYRWSKASGLEILANDPQGVALAAPTNVVFTGEGLRTLVVPNLGRWNLSRADLGVAGIPLFYPTSEQIDGVDVS